MAKRIYEDLKIYALTGASYIPPSRFSKTRERGGVILRRVDVLKEEMSARQILKLRPRDQSRPNSFYESARAALTLFYHGARYFSASDRTVESAERLHAPVPLHRHDRLPVFAEKSQPLEQLSRDEGQVAGHNSGPLCAARIERRMKAAQSAPLLVNVRHVPYFQRRIYVFRPDKVYTARDLTERLRYALDE